MNARFFLPGKLEGIGYFTKEVVQLLVRQHPTHQFHLLYDRPFDAPLISSANVHHHIVSPPARHPLLWKFWFDVKVPTLLKKLKADVFFSPDGQCSLRTKVPQCVVVHDLAFLHYPDGYQKSHLRYYKHYTPKLIKKATRVITVSEFSKQDIIAQYKTQPQKINVAYNGVKDVFKPLSFDEQTLIKEKYTSGAEFFLYAGAIHPRKNLLNLLKAFSIFKRRLQSSMKLVLAGRLAWKNEEFLALLKTYKYKDDVMLTGYLPEEELAQLMAAAYAFVYPSLFEGFGVPVIEAMRCKVPVLTSKDSSMQEITEGAALYFDPHNIEDVAQKLMRIYKDEEERKGLIEKGFAISKNYSWQNTAKKIWKEIEAATGKSGEQG